MKRMSRLINYVGAALLSAGLLASSGSAGASGQSAPPVQLGESGAVSAAEADGWSRCAVEDAQCAFNGTRTVRYGGNGTFTTRSLSGGTACSNAVFGDPLPGVVKHCELQTAAVAACTSVDWAENTNYALGTVVKYLPNGLYYKLVNVAGNGSGATNPTISTWYWSQTTCANGNTGAVAKIVGGYYPNWPEAPLRIRDVNPRYNLIYLFAAHPVGGSPGTTGAVEWTAPGNGRSAGTYLKEDIRYARTTQGRKIILSVGGAGFGMSFPNRTKSQNFINSIVGIYNQLGGFDGMDWNTFEADQAPDTAEMIWISLELKRRYPGFLISAPPAPWSQRDKDFCKAMVAGGAMDYAAPQYYDGPNLSNPSYVVSNVKEWVALLGENRVVVGFGINNAVNYMTPAQAVSAWNQVKANHPAIRGGFDWEINTDERQGWPFANTLAPLIHR